MKTFAKLENDECVPKEIDYGKHVDKGNRDYIDIYEGIQSELNYVVKYDETINKDITYISKKIIERKEKFKAEESFPVIEQGMTMGKLLDGTDCLILLEKEASRSFMSKTYYHSNKSLHDLPKFSCKKKYSSGKWSILQHIIYNPSDSKHT